MKLKLAAIAMIASVALSCDTSFGCELLDRMLGRAGCSSCQAPKAPSCGCGGGLMDKLVSKSAGCGCGGSDMLTYDANMSCGPVASPCGCEAAPAADCGCSAPAPVADCGCEAPAAPACDSGCGVAKKPCSLGLFSKLKSGGCGSPAPAPAPVADCGCEPVADCGCEAPVVDCGCEAPAVVAECGVEAPACDSGCGAAKKPCFLGLFSKLKGNGCGSPAPVADCGAPVADCGCEAPAPVADCGCEAPAPVADCGCEAPAPVADCGCEAPAPVADCGCGAAKKPCSLGLFSKFKKGGCGCDSPAPAPACEVVAPAVSDCGCSAPVVTGGCGTEVAQCGCNSGTRGKLSLLDRLRGNRIPRTREGVVIGSECNDGCNPPCPAQPSADCGCAAPVYEAAPCNSCGGGEVIYSDAQPVSGGCSACGTSEGQIVSQGEVIYSDDVAAPATSMGSEEATNVAPVVPEADSNSTEGVIESGDAATEAAPVVDPGAFIPPRSNTVGS